LVPPRPYVRWSFSHESKSASKRLTAAPAGTSAITCSLVIAAGGRDWAAVAARPAMPPGWDSIASSKPPILTSSPSTSTPPPHPPLELGRGRPEQRRHGARKGDTARGVDACPPGRTSPPAVDQAKREIGLGGRH